jgi:hypothetical protein
MVGPDRGTTPTALKTGTPTLTASGTAPATSAPIATETPTPAATRGAQQGIYSELVAKAAEEGHILVIVELNLPTGPFKPEGTLTPEDVEKQREAIVATREALLASLDGYNAVAYAAWESVPHVGLRVDLEALQQLIISPYVTMIQEDSLNEPQ